MIFTSFEILDLIFLREKIASVAKDYTNLRFALTNETENTDLLRVIIYTLIENESIEVKAIFKILLVISFRRHRQ